MSKYILPFYTTGMFLSVFYVLDATDEIWRKKKRYRVSAKIYTVLGSILVWPVSVPMLLYYEKMNNQPILTYKN